MNKTVKKFAALLLALAMTLTALPAAAFAADGEADTGTAQTAPAAPAADGAGGDDAASPVITTHIYTGSFTAPQEDPYFNAEQGWTTSPEQSFMVGFKSGGSPVSMSQVEYTGAVLNDQTAEGAFGVTKGGANSSMTGLGDTYLFVSVLSGAAAGNYTLNFTVNGTPVSLKVIMRPGVYAYYSEDGQTWQKFSSLTAGTNKPYQVIFSNKLGTEVTAADALGNVELTYAACGGKNLTQDHDEYFTCTVDESNVCTLVFLKGGTYNLSFSVMNSDGISGFVSMMVMAGQTTGSFPQTQVASSPDSQEWQTATYYALQAGYSIYLRVMQNDKSVPFALNPSGSTGDMVKVEPVGGDDGQGRYGLYKLTGGSANGNAQFSILTSLGGNSGFSVIVTGNQEDPDAPSGYVSAQVKQAFANSGVVTFTGVGGEASDPLPQGFTLENGQLSFDTAGKDPGLYEAVVGGQTYAVAVMNPISGDDAQGVVTVSMTSDAPTDLPAGDGRPDGLYYAVGSAAGYQAKQMGFAPKAGGETAPLYVYYVKGGQVEPMTGYNFTLSATGYKADGFFEGEIVSVRGVDVLKLTVKPGVPVSAVLPAYVTINDSTGSFVGAAEFYLNGANTDTFGFATDPTLAGTNNTGARRGIDQRFNVGGAPAATQFYITKGSGDNGNMQPAQYDLALYDDVDVSTLTVTSSNNAFVAVKNYLSVTPEGKNAIGFELEVKDNTRAQMAEITVSFQDKSGTPHTYKGVVNCTNAQVTDTRTVSSAAEFIQAYEELDAGTIVMKGGTYSMDLVHTKPIVIQAAEGEKVTINGSEGGSGPIITIALGNPGDISGVTIDGRGKTRDGINANGYNGYANNITIQDCAVGIRNGGGDFWAILATNSVFKNNKVAVQGDSSRLVVQNCTFEGNEVAVSFVMNSYTECRVQMNRFVDNTADFLNQTTSDPTATQNYYLHGDSKAPVIQTVAPMVGTNGTVYYSPWFVDEAMTLYTADLEGARPGSTRATAGYTVPVDRTISRATLLDSALFEEMKGQEAAVSIPVTEKVEDKALVTTIWEFDSGKLASSLPAQMDLEVTDQPTDGAKAVVDKAVANPDAIAQYVHFSHDGTLPGTATVLVRKTGEVSADELKLYYINEATGTVEEAEIVAVDETTVDGVDYYVVTVAHCSEYLIAGALTLKEEGTEGGGTTGGTEGGTTGGTEGGNSGSSGNTGSTGSGAVNTGSTGTAAQPATGGNAQAPVQTPAATGSANQLVSALEVEERFAAAEAGSEVAFDVARKPQVSAGAFGILAQNPDKALVLEGEGYAWRFEGAALTDPGAIEGASFDTTVSLTSPNAHLIAPLVKDVPAVNVYFSYHGALPGPAQVSVQLGAEHAGSVKYLYYFNSTAVTLEYVGEAKVDASGVATFTIEHCSDYVLLDEKLEETDASATTPEPEATAAPEATQAPAAQETGAPSGGSTGFILAAVAAAAVLAAVILLLVRRRKGE